MSCLFLLFFILLFLILYSFFFYFFFFNDTATTEIYTLSLHDALPIYVDLATIREKFSSKLVGYSNADIEAVLLLANEEDRKSTRLNSSHGYISYAVFCLKKKKKKKNNT